MGADPEGSAADGGEADNGAVDHRAELLAAAAEGDLTPAQAAALDELRAQDPSVDTELEGLRETIAMLRTSGVTWREEEIPPEPTRRLGERIAAATTHDGRRRGASLSRGLVGVAAAALLVVGGVAGALVQEVRDAPTTGPPGTLGALEEITFTGSSSTSIEASLVAHTWGTETILEVDGAPLGQTFAVVLLSEDGEKLTSGTFFGTEQTVLCRMNAAVLRPDVAEVVIEAADGTVLASSDVPDVET